MEVERVELKTIAHPAGLHQSMAVEARATREARAKVHNTHACARASIHTHTHTRYTVYVCLSDYMYVFSS